MPSIAERKLARTLYGISAGWRTYDRHAEHTGLTWVRRLDAAMPKDAREAAMALVNFDWMRDAAAAKYDGSPFDRAIADKTFAAWQAYRAALAAPAIAA